MEKAMAYLLIPLVALAALNVLLFPSGDHI